MRKRLRSIGVVAVLALTFGVAPAAPANAAAVTVFGICGATNFAFLAHFVDRGGYESQILSPQGKLKCWFHEFGPIGKSEAIEVWGYPIPGNNSSLLLCSVNKNLSTVSSFVIAVKGQEMSNTGCAV